jgi:hypothetical protein
MDKLLEKTGDPLVVVWMLHVPGDNSCRDSGSAQDKFTAVTETKALNALELFECCREKGLYPEQVVSWHEAASTRHSFRWSGNTSEVAPVEECHTKP